MAWQVFAVLKKISDPKTGFPISQEIGSNLPMDFEKVCPPLVIVFAALEV